MLFTLLSPGSSRLIGLLGCICQDASVISWNWSYIAWELVRGKQAAQPLSKNTNHGPIMHLDRQRSPVIRCQTLQHWAGGAGGSHVSHLGGRQCSHHQSTKPGSSSSRLNGILNMAVLTLRTAINHLEEFYPSNYICHCQPFSENRDCSPRWCFQNKVNGVNWSSFLLILWLIVMRAQIWIIQ